MALVEQSWSTKPITSPEALLSFNRMAILWGNRGSKVVGITYSQSRDVPSDGRDSGRREIESPRRMRVSKALLITDSAGEPIGLHLGIVGADTHFVAA